MGPTNIAWAKDIFQIVRCVLLSTQGLVISLPYCYLNTEVQMVIKTHYKRWQLIRNVGTGQMSHRPSLSASTAYTTVNKAQAGQQVQVLPAFYFTEWSPTSIQLYKNQQLRDDFTKINGFKRERGRG